MMNYTEISSLKELRIVRKQLAFNIAQKERGFQNLYQLLKTMLSPAEWVRRALQSVESLKEVWHFVQSTWQAILNFFRSKKKAPEEFYTPSKTPADE